MRMHTIIRLRLRMLKIFQLMFLLYIILKFYEIPEENRKTRKKRFYVTLRHKVTLQRRILRVSTSVIIPIDTVACRYLYVLYNYGEHCEACQSISKNNPARFTAAYNDEQDISRIFYDTRESENMFPKNSFFRI